MMINHHLNCSNVEELHVFALCQGFQELTPSVSFRLLVQAREIYKYESGRLLRLSTFEHRRCQISL